MTGKNKRLKKQGKKTTWPRPSRDEAEKAVRTLLLWAGDNPAREGLAQTPRRVAKAFGEYFSGYAQDPLAVLKTSFADVGGYDGMIAVRDINFTSHCEHHLAPFTGKAHIAYIPGKNVAGISKLARVVDIFARRLQVQERMTAEIADALMAALKPKGVAVMIEAAHSCMSMRGARKDGARTITTRYLGAFRGDDDLREEFLASIRG